MPRLNSTGKSLLLADLLEQLEVLRVARADLQHHAGRRRRPRERGADLVDVRARAVTSMAITRTPCLPASSKTQGRHCLAEALEVVRAGARLVGAHARGRDARLAQRGASSALDVLARVDRAEAGEDVDSARRRSGRRCTRSHRSPPAPRGGR